MTGMFSLVSFLFSSLHPKCFRIKFLLLVYIFAHVDQIDCACDSHTQALYAACAALFEKEPGTHCLRMR